MRAITSALSNARQSGISAATGRGWWAAPQAIASRVIIERVTPLRVVCGGALAWLILFLLAPVDARWPSDATPIVLFLACYCTLICGIVFPHVLQLQFRPHRFGMAQFRLLFLFCLGLAFAGGILKLVDVFVMRGVDIDDTFMQARDVAARQGASGISAAAAVLVPFGVAAMLIAAAGRRVGYLRHFNVMTVVAAVMAPLTGVLFGSRSHLLLLGLNAGLAVLLLRERITFRQAVLLAVSAAASLLVFQVMFLLRLEQFGMDYRYVARYSAYTIVLPLQRWYLDLIDIGGSLGAFMAAFASLFQYYLHGVFEFFWLVELKQSHFAEGSYQFFIVSKFLALLSGKSTALDDLELDLLNPRAGVFQSYFGPAYVDFGTYVVLFSFVTGFVAEFSRLVVRAGNVFALPLYVFMLLTLALLPIVSGILMSAGVIAFCCFVMLAATASLVRRLFG